ncbi:hypothetical protein F441_00378 [Phytophthora nicotianae CJ01A1]|uniref:Uncharacterized protein n=3 Tax=Phytophthora nicotianae TaxID=4792 RepID=W2XYR0_PHYNI|nr:hypothetical protein L914_00356 [Phytophthora nicotianae]ETO86033.1 hypothetical protein F444_00380 [Phytophthora nicotianae P1976]ETP27069.1 hypothetical protein F441_00378 [Phytophthora nicotianae CJ01A1]
MQETYGTNYSSVFDRRHAYQEISDPSASRRQHIFHRIHTSSSARVTRITINSLLRESPHTVRFRQIRFLRLMGRILLRRSIWDLEIRR